MKNNNVLLIIAVLVSTVLIAGCTSQTTQQQPTTPTQQQPPAGSLGGTTLPETPPMPPDVVTMSQLASHNSPDDCWVAYDGKIYDVTSYLPIHKGGPEKIIPYCGTADDFANAFEDQHGLSKVAILMQQLLKGTLV